MAKKILRFLAAWKLFVYIFTLFGISFLPVNTSFIPSLSFRVNIPYLVWAFGNFDGVHYMEIARNGYHNFQFGFFPFYPLLIYIVNIGKNHGVFFPYLFVGQFISHLSLFLALYYMIKLLIYDRQKGLVNYLLVAILLFPTSFFLGAVYNDSLFLFLATVCIYYGRKRKWFYSSIAGAFATMTRLNGLALCFFIICEYLLNKKSNNFFSLPAIKKEKIYSVILIPFAFSLYLFYIQVVYGNWNLVFSSMSLWNQSKITFPLQVFWRYYKIIFLYPTFILNYWVAIIEVFFVVFYIFIMIFSFKKIRFSYWVFFVISIIIPSLTGTFSGMPRYGLHIFPFFLSIALLLQKRGSFFKTVYFVISILLLFICITLFTRGYFIA